jgi:hypothetical protein
LANKNCANLNLTFSRQISAVEWRQQLHERTELQREEHERRLRIEASKRQWSLPPTTATTADSTATAATDSIGLLLHDVTSIVNENFVTNGKVEGNILRGHLNDM